MGLYTEVIRERDRIDREMVKNADYRMMNRQSNPGSAGDDNGAFLALDHILESFGLNADEVYGYESTEEMLDLVLDPLGIIYDAIDTTDGSWKRGNGSILGFLEDGTAAVLTPAMVGYRYMCPSTGAKGHVTDKVRLQERAYVIQRPIALDQPTLLNYAIYVLRLISPRDVVAIGLAALMISALGLVTPKMNKYILQDIVPMGNDGFSLLTRGLFLFLLTGIIRSGITAVRSLFLSRMSVRVASEMQSAVMSKVLTLPQTFFLRTSTGKLSKQITNSRLLADQIISFVMGASLTALFSVVYIPQMAGFSMTLLIPALAVLLVRCIYIYIASGFFAENERSRQEAELDNRSFLYSALKGIQRIKESGSTRRVYAKWAARYQSVLACDMNQPAILKLESVIMGFLSSLTTVILLALVVPSGITKADYIAFNAAFAIIAAAVEDLMDAQRKVFLMRPMMAQLRYIFEAPSENGREQTVLREFRGDIRIENVNFAYENSSFGCLNDISLHIAAGEKVAIVGESGCGKSTLLKIILGVLRPVTGGVFIDNRPLETINLRSFRRHIGSVFQFSRVMPGTVYSNIAFCPHPVSREEAKEAAVKADIDDTIMKLPLGYDTEISDSNTGGFSGGQRQRLLLARAFASKPGLLILDEATSALDNISQKKVLDAVYQEKCTVIMVAHRLSTVKECDRIIVLKDGGIAEEGTFDELMELKGYFHELMKRQSA